MSKDTFAKVLDRLVTKFNRDQAVYTGKTYQERELQAEFIEPMFEALGWDITNRAGNPPHLREVTLEARVPVGRHKTRADYTFNISGQPRFVLETKKPSEDIEDPRHILQLKKYAWNLSVRFAVLTNFCQTKVYAVPGPPSESSPNSFTVESVEFFKYMTQPGLLHNLLSRERVLSGALDKAFDELPKDTRLPAYQKSILRMAGSRRVDSTFLDALMSFRKHLAEKIFENNPKAGLQEPEINEAVQRIIDRIVFLRIGEDRGIVYAPRLLDLVEKWEDQSAKGDLYPQLVSHFTSFNKPYNGLLFKRHELSENLKIPNDLLRQFIQDISIGKSDYLFDVIPVEILGSVYERFLGSVVRITPSRIKVDEKPEVRKAGGVYYTPKYIVDYIVSQTVGKLLEGRTPEQVTELKVLDPACGSGSFLLGAFTRIMEYLVEWFHHHPGLNGRYRDWYYLDETQSIRLTPYAKRRILLNNIYGVDIDPQACEVTQLSLYLKLLEGESAVSLREHQAKKHAEAFLPDLRNNIKCGNSLIASDFSVVPQELLRVNSFDWDVQFSGIMKTGGFNAVVGNPPWIDIKGFDPEQTDYFFRTYNTVENRMNVYAVFIHRGIDLLKKGGLLGFITPNSFLTQSSYARLRAKLLENQVVGIVRTPDNVFEGVTAESAISIYHKVKPTGRTAVMVFPPLVKLERIDQAKTTHFTAIDQAGWRKTPSQIFNLNINPDTDALLAKVEQAGRPLLDFCEFCLGLTPYDKHKGHSKAQIDGRVFHSPTRKTQAWKPLLQGADIHRFFVHFGGLEYIHYGPWLGAPREQRFFTEARILVRQIISGVPPRIYSGYTEEELYNAQIAFNLILRSGTRESLKYLLGIMNSKLMTWFHREKFLDLNKSTFQKILIQDAKTFPIRSINFSSAVDRARHDRLVSLVDKMLVLMPKFRAARTDAEREILQNAITATDRQIDTQVYKLFDLTKGEIELVQKSSE